MTEVEKSLLDAIHKVDKKVGELDNTINKAIEGRFKDHERRIGNVENNQRWVIYAIIGVVISAILNVVMNT